MMTVSKVALHLLPLLERSALPLLLDLVDPFIDVIRNLYDLAICRERTSCNHIATSPPLFSPAWSKVHLTLGVS